MEGQSLSASSQFDTFGFTAAEHSRKQAEKEQHERSLCTYVSYSLVLLMHGYSLARIPLWTDIPFFLINLSNMLCNHLELCLGCIFGGAPFYFGISNNV